MNTPPFLVQDVKEVPNSVQTWFRQIRNELSALVKKNVAGGVQVNLSSDESRSPILEFSGVLTANINVVIATITRQWIVFNNTTGAFTLTVKTLSGTGIAVGQGKRAILYCDGTNVVRATVDV